MEVILNELVGSDWRASWDTHLLIILLTASASMFLRLRMLMDLGSEVATLHHHSFRRVIIERGEDWRRILCSILELVSAESLISSAVASLLWHRVVYNWLSVDSINLSGLRRV